MAIIWAIAGCNLRSWESEVTFTVTGFFVTKSMTVTVPADCVDRTDGSSYVAKGSGDHFIGGKFRAIGISRSTRANWSPTLI